VGGHLALLDGPKLSVTHLLVSDLHGSLAVWGVGHLACDGALDLAVHHLFHGKVWEFHGEEEVEPFSDAIEAVVHLVAFGVLHLVGIRATGGVGYAVNAELLGLGLKDGGV